MFPTRAEEPAPTFWLSANKMRWGNRAVKLSRFLERIMPHICIILSLDILVLFVIDRFNTAMAFINNDITKWMLCVLTVISIITSLMLYSRQRKDND